MLSRFTIKELVNKANLFKMKILSHNQERDIELKVKGTEYFFSPLNISKSSLILEAFGTRKIISIFD